MTSVAPCKQEEADTRILLHAKDAVMQGYERILIRTVDTDVIVLSIAMVRNLGLSELWIAFGTGNNFRHIPAHSIAQYLGEKKSKCLPLFHSITGCDQASSFAGKGKKSAWGAWQVYDDVSDAFEKLLDTPSLETLQEVLPLFPRKGRSIEAIPPTADAFLQHAKRAVYQAAYCWAQCLSPRFDLPSPSQWGWHKQADEKWKPIWITLQPASVACQELLKCGCKQENGSRSRCKCRKADLPCTALCNCGGECD